MMARLTVKTFAACNSLLDLDALDVALGSVGCRRRAWRADELAEIRAAFGWVPEPAEPLHEGGDRWHFAIELPEGAEAGAVEAAVAASGCLRGADVLDPNPGPPDAWESIILWATLARPA